MNALQPGSATSAMRGISVIFLLALLVCSCAVDPRSQAEADATTLQAQQDAANQEQLRKQEQERFVLEQKQHELESAQWVESWNTFVKWSMGFATVAVCVVLLSLGAGFSWASIGTGQAIANRNWVQSNIIPLDKTTRQFPAYLQSLGNGLFTLTDLNTGVVLNLDVRNSGDREMIRAAGQARIAGTVAEAARKHKGNPAGVARYSIRAAEGAIQVIRDSRMPSYSEEQNCDRE